MYKEGRVEHFARLNKYFIQRYERYLPTAFDESMTLLEKVNKVIEGLNTIVRHINDQSETLEEWQTDLLSDLDTTLDDYVTELNTLKNTYETFREDILNDILPDSTLNILTGWFNDGTLEQIINENIFNDIRNDILKKADKSETQNFQDQLDTLVLGSGDSSAEVVGARGTQNTLNGRVDYHEHNLLKQLEELYGDVKGVLRPGFYSSSTGSYTDNVTDWFHFYVYNGLRTQYELIYPDEIQLRIVEFDETGTFIGSKLITNGYFTVSENTREFAVTVALTSADPPSGVVTSLPSKNDLYNIVIKEKTGVVDNVSSLNKIIDENLLNTPIKIGEQKTIIETTFREGFFNSTDGVFHENEGWRAYDINVDETREYIIENPDDGEVRLLTYNAMGYKDHIIIPINQRFKIDDDVTRFAVNIALEGTPTGQSKFSDVDSFELYKYAGSYVYRSLLSRVADLSDSSKWGGKTLHVFGDSNSNNSGVTVWHTFIEEELGMSVVNYAEGGAGYISKSSTNDKLNIPEQITSSTGDADLVVIFAGGNDYSGSRPLNDFQNAVDTSYHDAIEKYPHATIVVFTQTRRENEGENNAGVTVEDQVNIEIEKAGKYSLPILNLYHAGNVHPWNTTWLNTYMPDGVHLSTEGHRKLKDKVIAFFNNL